MLKNMAVHELAILVTFYGVTSTNIVSVVPDKKYSSCQVRAQGGSFFFPMNEAKFGLIRKKMEIGGVSWKGKEE